MYPEKNSPPSSQSEQRHLLPSVLPLGHHSQAGETDSFQRENFQAALLAVWQDIAESLRRLVEIQAPFPKEKEGSPYVAQKLGCTKVYVAEMARIGVIPKSCIVPGTGCGKPWKFYRDRIDQWIQSR